MDSHGSPQDFRTRLRYAIVSLEDKDLEQQAHYGVKAVVDSLETVGDAIRALKDLLSGLDGCSKHAVRARLTLASYTLRKYAPTPGLVHAAAPAAKLLLGACFADPANTEMLSTLFGQLVSLCLKSGSGYDADSAAWLADTFLNPLLRAAYRDPESHRAATACAVTQAVLQTLQGFSGRAHVADAIRSCLATALQLMASSTGCLRVAATFVPVQACLNMVGEHLDAGSARKLLGLCAKALANRDSWRVRREALDTLQAGFMLCAIPACAS